MTPTLLLLLSLCPAQEEKPPGKDLTELSLEELMNVEITAVTKREQKLMAAPAAVFVISGEDLRRTGVTSIAEALRRVPGLQVARLDSNKWAISSRGFNGRFANKLLVLVDGRSVYTPLFSGVYWDVQDTLLEDIDRIEVIRGPGGTSWGANAVNGVIHIVTKSARETRGAFVRAGRGTEDRGFAGARLGTTIDDRLHFRVFGSFFDRDEFRDGRDEWTQGRAGMRADWELSPHDTLTLTSEYYAGDYRDRATAATLDPPFVATISKRQEVSGGFFFARWERRIEEASHVAVQAWYDRQERRSNFHEETRDTFDVEFEHRFRTFWGQDVVWGAGYRLTSDDLQSSFTLSFDPEEDVVGLANAFVQDEFTLVEDRLRLTIGSKFEYHDYTRLEIQPGARIAWTPHERHAAWAAVSRAVRTPSRTEHDGRINRTVLPGAPPVVVALIGDDDFRSEELLSVEAGYRVQPVDALTIDLALFYNLYDDLRTLEPRAPFAEGTHLVFPFVADNEMEGRAYGFELAARFQPFPWWRLEASFAFLRIHLRPDDDSADPTARDPEGESPRSQLWLRSSMDLPRDLQLDVMLRTVGALSGLDVDSYVELNARLAWRWKNLEVSIVGQNLLHRSHPEFRPAFLETEPTEAERGVYLGFAVRF